MTVKTSCTWLFAALFIISLTFLVRAPYSQADQAPAATVEEETEASDDAGESEEVEEVDPYEVPDGTPEELLEYIKSAPQRMAPDSRETYVRMFESLGVAADKVLAAEEAKPNERMKAVQTKLQTLGMLSRVGHADANTQLNDFLEKVLEDESAEIQAFAKKVRFQRQLGRWGNLSQAERDEVVTELRENLSGDDLARDDVVMLMRFADSIAETADAEVAIELIGEVLPRLEASEDPEVASRAVSLEGIARRLQLPGNEMELEGKLLSGEEVDWDSYRGKVVLVDFWATWCGPCIAEVPNVLQQYETYHDKGFEVLGISLDDDAADVQAFVEDKELPWVTLYSDDPEATGWHHPMATRYGINAIPRAILVDQEGNVVHMNARGNKLAEALVELLGPAETPEEDDESDEVAAKVGETASTQP
ncbi:MAG: TlpA family protein disulfide reductase [Aeoliella sp.]